ncbi:MAG: site-specific integrase [Candidatus Micrarchaeota archaeon]|nr:site-specific integrase [Candidatus Micrarchaeota archaeon]
MSGAQCTVSRGESGRFSVSGGQCSVCSKEQSLSNPPSSALGTGNRKQITHHWPNIKQNLEHFGRFLSKRHLVKAITILSDARKSRFLRMKTPKYGSMNKGFTEQELERFFEFVDEPKFRLMFSYQAILGLRIGEAVRINVKDINLRTKEIRIFTEKRRKTDFLLIPDKLFEGTIEYIAEYEQEICKAKGYLFFSLRAGNRKPDTDHRLTTSTTREYFGQVCKKAGLDEVYGYRYGKKAYPLRRLTTHSLRHFAITNFCKKNNGNVQLASKFARHTNLQATMTYIHTQKEDLYSSIRNAQEGGIIDKVKNLQKKIS